MGAKPRDILQEMINEAQRLHEEFAQSSTGDSIKVTFVAAGVIKLLFIDCLCFSSNVK